jgi:molybdate transport system ATP-binding protein
MAELVRTVSLQIKIRHRFAGRRGFTVEAGFDAAPGVSVLFGPSGSGKTTVLEVIAGLLPADAAQIELDGREISKLASSKRNIGYVFQSLALFPHMTVEENVRYGLARLSRTERVKRVSDILERFRIAHIAKQRPGTISGGERQRVALARTLVTEPRALLLDEPMSALDIAIKREIIADLRTWIASRQIPVIYVTHILHEAFSLAEKVIVLREGRIVRQGTPAEALAGEREYLLQVLSI